MTIDELLSEAREVPTASDDTIHGVRRAVVADVESSVARIRRVAARRTKRRRLAGAVIATAACGTALMVVPRGDDGPPSATATAASPGSRTPSPSVTAPPPVESVDFKKASQVLTAAAAGQGPEDIARDSDAFWRVDLIEHGQDGSAVPRTVWSSRDAGLFVKSTDGVHSLGPTTFSTSGRTLSWDDLFELPTDRASMLRLLRGSSGSADADHIAFKTVFELLSTSPAPRAVRRALWLAAAELDGVSLVGRATDAEGRPGWAVTDGTSTYVVSPQTGRLLESRYEGPDGGVATVTMVREGSTVIAPEVAPRGR